MYKQICQDIIQDYYQQNFSNDGQRFVAWYLRNIHLRDPIQARDDITDGAYVYFVHSLFPVPQDKEIVCTQTEYGLTFTSAIASKNIYGTQFHPEKSGDVGLQILKNFARAVAR